MDRAKKAFKWAKENPLTAASGVVAGGGLAVVVAPALVTAPLLGLAGFGSSGIVGGSMAAGIQAGIGNVVAGSTFATLTSAGMGGYGAAAVAAAGQAVGGMTAAAGAAGVYMAKSKKCQCKVEDGKHEPSCKEGDDNQEVVEDQEAENEKEKAKPKL
ncbi:hypothetical protein V8F06_008385 [Rhypophila decipiens]